MNDSHVRDRQAHGESQGCCLPGPEDLSHEELGGRQAGDPYP
jgi:hypothetical protein